MPSFSHRLFDKSIVSLIKLASPLFAANVLNSLISSIIIILVARYLNPATYGRYAIILGVLQTSIGIVGAGLSTWAIREVARDPSSTNVVLASLLKILTIADVALVSGAVVALTILSADPLILLALVILSLQVALRSIGDALVSVLIGGALTRAAARANVWETMMSVLLIPTFLILGFSIVGLATAELCAAIARTVSSYRSLGALHQSRPTLREAKAVWAIRASRQFWVSQVSFGMVSRTQPIVIGVVDAGLAGLYAFGQRLFESSMFAISPLSAVLVAHVTNSLTRPEKMIRRWLTTVLLAAVLGSCVGLALIITARYVLPRWIGESYGEVYQGIWALGIAIVFLFISQVMNAYLIALSQEAYLAKTSVVASMLLVAGLGVVARALSVTLLFVYLLVWYAAIAATWGARVLRELRQVKDLDQQQLLATNNGDHVLGNFL